MKKLKFLITILFAIISSTAFAKSVKIVAVPGDAAIYIDNVFAGNGTAMATFSPGQNVFLIKIVREGYVTVETRIQKNDRRNVFSYTLFEDAYVQSSKPSGLVNKYITVTLDPSVYVVDSLKNMVDNAKAWRMLHEILLNYIDEIATTDFSGGFLQSPWAYEKFPISQICSRMRVTVRDISTVSRPAFQIKISCQTAPITAKRDDQFQEDNRLLTKYDSMIEELQTRIGKFFSL